METLKIGSLAYIDGFNGLVPCKVIAIKRIVDRAPSLRMTDCTVKVTARRYGYKLGEIVTYSASLVVPRKSVYRSRQHCGQYMIRQFAIEG